MRPGRLRLHACGCACRSCCCWRCWSPQAGAQRWAKDAVVPAWWLLALTSPACDSIIVRHCGTAARLAAAHGACGGGQHESARTGGLRASARVRTDSSGKRSLLLLAAA